MEYTVEDLEDILDEGEIEVVLESGVKYNIHKRNFTFDSDSGIISGEGWYDEKGEYYHVEFPASAVEHWRVHDTL